MARPSKEREEREAAVLVLIRDGMRYQAIGDALGLDKNKLYKVFIDLQKSCRITRTSPGQYVINEGTFVPDVAPVLAEPSRSKSEYKRMTVMGADVAPPAPESVPAVEAPATVVTFPTPPPPVKTKADEIEEIASTLMERISELQPALLLYKEHFVVMETITLALIERVGQLKPLLLNSKEEVEEYRELKALKERAVEIAAKNKQSKR